MKALPYYGGKAVSGQWIASHLPQTDAYVEPYAGMLGVLLARRPSLIEIVNDRNRDIANWWTQVRDHTDALARKVALTPRSREHLENANDVLASTDASLLDRAWATHICLAQGMHATTNGRARWKRKINANVGSAFRFWLPEHFAALAERIAGVQIDHTDAVKLLHRVADERDIVVYVDPPYHSAIREYQSNDVDVPALTDALRAQRGRVALSGYGDEWTHLGWRCVEKETVAWASPTRAPRIERLWMNYPATDASGNGDLFA